jgi:hypothetical protein
MMMRVGLGELLILLFGVLLAISIIAVPVIRWGYGS